MRRLVADTIQGLFQFAKAHGEDLDDHNRRMHRERQEDGLFRSNENPMCSVRPAAAGSESDEQQ